MQESVVIVVDDDPSVRRSVSALLAAHGYVVREFASGAEFLASPEIGRPGCIVMDLRMPGMSGLDVQAALAEKKLNPRIVFITGYGDVPSTVRAMKGGAVDFLEKPFKSQDLLEAVDRALKQDTTRRAESAREDEIRRRFERLTRREFEVVEQVVRGLTNKAIAIGFGISEKTIKVHRGRAMTKVEADSLAQLVRMAQTIGIGGDGVIATTQRGATDEEDDD
ncbi:MAG: response regulator transcription factor [Phycisphaerae bacterium]